jgi:hypothetical protein
LVTTQERVERTIGQARRLKELPMSTSFSQESAKIYQFPRGGRAALGGHRYGEAKPTIDRTPRVNEVMCSGSWYHEEAIQEDKAKWDR